MESLPCRSKVNCPCRAEVTKKVNGSGKPQLDGQYARNLAAEYRMRKEEYEDKAREQYKARQKQVVVPTAKIQKKSIKLQKEMVRRRYFPFRYCKVRTDTNRYLSLQIWLSRIVNL
jgi:hypothetical protein